MKKFIVLVCLTHILAFTSANARQSLGVVEQQMIREIHQELPKTIEQLAQAVNINSGTMNFPGVKAVGELMIAQLSALGFAAKWQKGGAFNRAGHVVAHFNHNQANKKKILMIGHLDTVFAKDDSFQQFQRLSETEASGPGVIDMKGGNAIILASLQALKKVNILQDLAITVVLTGDEESSGRPLALSKKAIVDAAKWADIALGFENGDSNIGTAMVARRSYLGWTLTVTGKAAHSSQIFTTEQGYGAVLEAARILNAFREQLSQQQNLTFNPGVIAGGTRVNGQQAASSFNAFGKANVIAQRLIVNGDLRGLTEQQVANARKMMQAIVSDNLAHTQAVLSFSTGYPPMAPTSGNQQLLSLYSQVSQDLGYGEVVAANPRKAGAADISFAANHVEMALDGLGLMGRGGHTKNEVADLTSLTKNIEKTAILLYRLSQNSAE